MAVGGGNLEDLFITVAGKGGLRITIDCGGGELLMAVGSGNLEELFRTVAGDEILTPIGDSLEELGLLTTAANRLEELRLGGSGLE
jgi:hypothetical protein